VGTAQLPIDLSTSVEGAIQQAGTPASVAGAIALAGFIWAASGMMGAIRLAFMVVWDGDVRRTNALFTADLPTSALLALVPLAHSSDVDGPLLLYVGIAAVLAASGAAALVRRMAPVRTRRDAATA